MTRWMERQRAMMTAKKKRPTLPADHPIRKLPDDLAMYRLILENIGKMKRQTPSYGVDWDFMKWAYDEARARNIPTECVSKVLNLVSLYPGGE